MARRRNRPPAGRIRTGKDPATRGANRITLSSNGLAEPLILLNLKSTLNKTPNFKQMKKRREEMQKKKNEEKQRQQQARKVGDLPPPQKP